MVGSLSIQDASQKVNAHKLSDIDLALETSFGQNPVVNLQGMGSFHVAPQTNKPNYGVLAKLSRMAKPKKTAALVTVNPTGSKPKIIVPDGPH